MLASHSEAYESTSLFADFRDRSVQVHGFPRIMGVLTHLDSFRNMATLRRTKKVGNGLCMME
eukprot:3549606-Pleurochrysis_carterae.AAC.2